jgi:hypothetical protein
MLSLLAEVEAEVEVVDAVWLPDVVELWVVLVVAEVAGATGIQIILHG